MEFPVDLLDRVDPKTLEDSAKEYMTKLSYRNPETHDYLTLPDSTKIEVGLSNMTFVPLYGVNIKQKVLALFLEEHGFKVVGLYLLGQWWLVEDILKTADPSRTGLLKVRTPGERIVLYALNRIIYRTKEMTTNEVPFLCHEENEMAKILWKDGEAIGFYSVKPEGSLCSSFLTHCYQLPVMDTIFVRKSHRGNGYGLHMLEDFVGSFKKDYLGLKYPLTTAMYKVCKQYLSTYPADKELLWEIVGIGLPFQRTRIAKKLQAMDLKGNHTVVSRLNFEAHSTCTPMEEVIPQAQRTIEFMEEVVEEVVQIKTKEIEGMPVTARYGSNNLKRKLREDLGETTEKIIRVDNIETGVQSLADEPGFKDDKSSLNVKEDTAVIATHSVADWVMGDLIQPVTETPAIMSEKEALGKTDMTVIIEQHSDNEKMQTVTLLETGIDPVDLPPLEVQKVVEVEIVKMTSGIEGIKDKTPEIKGNEAGKLQTEEEKRMSEKNVIGEDSKMNKEEMPLQKSSQYTQLDLKPVAVDSEDVSAPEKILTDKLTKNWQHVTERQKDSETDNKEETPVLPAEIEEIHLLTDVLKEKDSVGLTELSPTPADKGEACEKILQSQKDDKPSDMTVVTEEDVEPVKKGKASVVERISGIENEAIGETEKRNNDIMETWEDSTSDEAGVLEFSESDREQMEKVQCEDISNPSNVSLLRHSRRFKEQPPESELTKRVLRSSTKCVKDTSKQEYGQQCKPVKQQKELEQEVGESNDEQKEVIESNTGLALGEKISTNVITKEDDENVIGSIKDSVENVENEVDARHQNDKVTLEDTVIKDIAKPVTDNANLSVFDFHDAEVVKAVEKSAIEPAEQQTEVPATEMVPAEEGQISKEATLVSELQKASFALLDSNKDPPQQRSAMETAKESSPLLDKVGQELDKAKGSSRYREDVVPGLTVAAEEQMQEKKLAKDTSTVQETPAGEEKETEGIHKPSQCVDQESDTQPALVCYQNVPLTHKAELKRKQADNPYAGITFRHSKRLKEQAGETELTETNIHNLYLDAVRTEHELSKEKKKMDGCPGEENKTEEDIRTEQFTEQDTITTEDPDPGAVSTYGRKQLDLHDTVGDPQTEAEKKATVQTVDHSAVHDEGHREEPAAGRSLEQRTGHCAMESALVMSLQQTSVALDCSKTSPIQTSRIEMSAKTVQHHQGERANKTHITEEEDAFEEMKVPESISENLELNVEMGTDNTPRRDNEQEENILAKNKLQEKARDIPIEEESPAMQAIKTAEIYPNENGKNQSDDQESMEFGQEEVVQISHGEEAIIITTRSLRHRTVTVKFTPQRKRKRHLRHGVQADIEKEDADKQTDENESANGKASLEKQYILGEQETEALTAEEITDTEIKQLRKTVDQGDKVNEKSASDKEIGVEATTKETEKVSEMESVETEYVMTQNKEKEIVPLAEDSSALEKQVTGSAASATGSASSATGSATLKKVREFGNSEKENNQMETQSSKQEADQEDSDEEEATVITKHLRKRTVAARFPLKRTSERLGVQVIHTEEAQAEKEAEINKASNGQEPEECQNWPEKREIRTTEKDSKDKSEGAGLSCDVDRNDVISEKQEKKNITETDVGKAEEIVGGKCTGEEEPEQNKKNVTNEKTDIKLLEDGKHLTDDSLDKIESDKPEEENLAHGNPEQKKGPGENVQDKVEEQLLEKVSEGKSRVEGEKQLEEKEHNKHMSTTEEILHDVEERIVIERKTLQKRAITIKASTERQEQEEERGKETGKYEEIMEHQNKITDKGDTRDSSKEVQQESQQENKTVEGNTEASLIMDEMCSLELEEEDENDHREDDKKSKKKEASLKGKTSETVIILEKAEEREDQISHEEGGPAVMIKQVLCGSFSATASPEQRSTRQSKRLPWGSPREKTEAEVVREVPEEEVVREVPEEEETEKKTKERRKAIVNKTPRRSPRRLATPKHQNTNTK